MQLNTRLLLHNVKMVPSINVLMSSKKAISTENANPPYLDIILQVSPKCIRSILVQVTPSDKLPSCMASGRKGTIPM